MRGRAQVSGWSAERAVRAPDRRLVLFSSGASQSSARPVLPARSQLSAKRPARSLRLVVSGPVVALMAVAGGIAGNSSAGAAVPAATASRPAPAAPPGSAAPAGSAAPRGSAAPAAPAASDRPAAELDALAEAAAAPAARRGPRRIAKAMLGRFHWSVARQFPALNKLWNQESGWRVHAYNRHSGARGIPQADPGRKMASAGPDWATSATTQIRWGLRYIRSRYGSPRAAWGHEVHAGWY